MKTNQVQQAFEIVAAMGKAIMEAKEIPSGHLYAVMMPFFPDIQAYESALNVLKNTGLVVEDGMHLLKWKGE